MNQAVVARTRSSPDKKARAGAGTAGRADAGVPADPKDAPKPERRLVFISHANPEDNPAAAWFATQLTLLGYDVWCDLKNPEGAGEGRAFAVASGGADPWQQGRAAAHP